MSPAEIWTAARQWVPFAARTAGYGMISCLLGPFTRNHAASLWAMRRWSLSSVAGLGIEVESSGMENVPLHGPYVYCSNHQSLIDILVLGSVLPGDYKWAAKRSLMRVPFIGWHLRLAGHVPVDRGIGGKTADEAVERFARVLAEGKPLLIFPEGTRTLDGAIKPFKAGAFKAALRGDAPIVPVALDGTFQMMSKGDVRADDERKIVRVRIGAPIPLPAPGDEKERIEALREATSTAMHELFATIHRPPAPAPDRA